MIREAELDPERFYAALLDDDPQQLYDNAPCGYITCTPDGLITKVNTTFLSLTGLERADLVGKRRFAELLSAGGRIYHETHYAPLLRMGGVAREIAFEVVRADGRRLPVLVNAVMERTEQGEPRLIRVAVFDATHRRDYERQLLAAKDRAEAAEAAARAMAQTLQQTLLPPTPVDVPGLQVATAYRAAGDGWEVGGDFFDVFQVDEGTWMAAVGDVRGKGAEAALVASLVRHSVRAFSFGGAEPAAVLQQVNQVLLRDPHERFCTVALARLVRAGEGWDVTLALGGHPLPLLHRLGAWPEEVGASGTVLGVVAETSCEQSTVRLRPGDALILFTDGVSEARHEGQLYGEGRLVERVSTLPSDAEVLSASLQADVADFQGDAARDDAAIVVLTAT